MKISKHINTKLLMKINLIIQKIIFILLFLTLTSCYYKSSDYYNAQAEKLENEGKYKEAIELLDKAIEKKPKNIYALINRGVNKSLINDYKGAIDDYNKIIEIDRNNTLAYLNRGKNKARLCEYKEAIEDYNKAIKTKGGELIYFDKVENSFIHNGYEFDVKMEEIRLERGFARYNIDSLIFAIDDFNFCIQKKFEISTCYYMIGLISLVYGNVEEACKMLTKSMELGNVDAQKMINQHCTNVHQISP